MNTPESDPVLERLMQISQLAASGDIPAAAAQLDEVAQTAPEDPRVYLMGARMAETANKPEAARDYLRHAMDLSPRWEVPATEMALLLVRQNDLTEALKAAEWAVHLAPRSLDVLYRVIDIAHAALNLELALEWLQRAAALDPGNVVLQTMIARDLAQLGRYTQAIEAYTALIEAAPEEGEFRLGRAKAALSAGQTELAQSDCDALVAQFPDNATYRFWQQIIRGEVPSGQPAEMVQALFDDYAALFDMHLVEGLKYKVPERVAELVQERYGFLRLDLLDIGCGTGLLGKALGVTGGELVGLDLSPRMLEQATKLGLYDKLVEANLLDYLGSADAPRYEVVAACDVFIYLGDLTEVVPKAFREIKPGGYFIFSCEAAQPGEPDLVLRPSTRYAHQATHVRTLCEQAGFDEIKFEDITVRIESDQRIEGFIAIARKPA
jgi:predicted TPR repeat methyltransferase